MRSHVRPARRAAPRLALVLAALASATPSAALTRQGEPATSDGLVALRGALPGASADALAERVRALGAELGQHGFELDLARVPLQVEAADALATRAAALALQEQGPGHAAAQHVLRAALARPLGDDVAGTRARLAERLAAGRSVLYDPHAEVLVVAEPAAAGLAADDAPLVRELARAWLDQRGDLEPRSAAAPTLERAQLARALADGLAEGVAVLVLLARAGRAPADLAPAELEPWFARISPADPEPVLADAARAYVLAGLRAHGSGWLARAARDWPLSGETLLHAEKRAAEPDLDLPAALVAPVWPAALGPASVLHDGALGELGLLSLLIEAGLAPPAARRAAAGWDGDRLVVWQAADELACAWRIVFDRDEDAGQLAGVWGRFGGRFRRAERAFLFAYGADAAAVDALLAALAALETPPADADDARTSAAVEERLRPSESKARLSDGRWVLLELGLSFPAPEGWTTRTLNGTPFLFAPQPSGFVDNLNAILVPNPGGGDARRIAADNQRGLEQMPAVQRARCEVLRAEGLAADVVLVRYAAVQGGNDLEFRVLLIPRGDQQIVITATLLAARAAEQSPLVEQALLGVRRAP